MSQHPSLKSSKAGKRHRSVLKRYERFFTLKEKGVLKDKASIFGMPKLKIVRAKIKKEKTEEKPEGAELAAEGAAEAGTQKETTAKTPKAEKKEAAAKPKKEEKKK